MPTYKALSTVTVGAGGASSIAFTNIPQFYTDLVIMLCVRTNRNFTNDSLALEVNGSTSDRNGIVFYGDGTGVATTTTTSEVDYAGLNGGTSTSNTFSNIFIYCPSYATANTKVFNADAVSEQNTSQNAYASINSWRWNNTAAITSLTFKSATGASFVQYSTATLYGISNIEVSTIPSKPAIGASSATGKTTATVGFTGVSNALSYTATSSPGSITGTGTTSPISVTGLSGGTSYTFTVKANNQVGSSYESTSSNSITTSNIDVTTATAMPAARAFGTAPSNAYHSGRYWYVGGATVTNPDTNAQNSVYSFNGTSWTTETNYPFSYNGSSAVSDGTNLYVIGGSPVSGTSTAVRYISGTGGTWSSGPSLPAGAHRQACVYYSGKIHAMNGDDDGGGATLRHYRLDSGSWTTLSNTGGSNVFYPSAAVYNSKIYRYSYGSFTSYNGTSWTSEAAPPATNRYSVVLLTIGSRIYAIGGTTGLWANTAVNTIYSFDGTAWTVEATTLPVEKGWHSGGTDGTVGYVYGGINNSSSVVATNYKITP